MAKTDVDVAVFGGGIAGLWLLTRLRSEGYSAVLFETNSLGSQQTIASQGIIHGGFKYLFSKEKVEDVAHKLADMPNAWRNALSGNGPVDLRGAKINSEKFYLCVPGRLMRHVLKRTTPFVTGDSVEYVRPKNWPIALKNYEFKGGVVAVDEPVINVPSVLETLSELNKGFVYKTPSPSSCKLGLDGSIHISENDNRDNVSIKASRCIVTTGADMDFFVKQLGLSDSIQTQRRPLNMVMMKGNLPDLYAHFLSPSFRPALTVTSHPNNSNENVWYVGGNLAESLIGGELSEFRSSIKKAFSIVLPKLDTDNVQISKLAIDRGEPKTKLGFLPDDVSIQKEGNILFCFPTKLTLAPRLAERVLEQLKSDGITPANQATLNLLLPRPSVAKPYWDIATWTK